MNNNNYVPLILYSILGLPLLVMYGLIIPKDFPVLWSNNYFNNIKQRTKIIYMISMIISTISALYVLWYLTKNLNEFQETNKYLVIASLTIILGFSLLWLPSFYFNNQKLTKLILFIISISALVLFGTILRESDLRESDLRESDLRGSKKPYEENCIIIGTSFYLFFHLFFFDFLLWTGII